MRVVQMIDNLQLVGGAQKMQVMLAKSVQRGVVDLMVISLQDDRNSPIYKQLQSYGVQIAVYPAKTLLDPSRLGRIIRFLKRGRFDILHTHLTHANIIGILSGRLAGVPVIAGLRNSRIQERRFHLFRYGLETFLLRFGADCVMAVGNDTAKAHSGRLGGRPVHVIQNCVALPEPLPSAERLQVRRSLIGDSPGPLIISVGRLVPQKGYEDLLIAFSNVRLRHPSARLVIVGTGRLYEHLQAQISSHRLGNHVFLLGPRTDVHRLLSASDLYVNSSLWEGLSNALLEAMSTGLPVVATDVGDTSQVVVDGTGLLVPPNSPEVLSQAICTLLDDPPRIRASGAAARDYVAKNHDPVSWAEQMLALYKKVIANHAVEAVNIETLSQSKPH